MGNDQLGSAVLADFAAEGVDVTGVKRVDSFSSAMIRNPGTTAPVEASYLRKGAAASLMQPEDLDGQLIARDGYIPPVSLVQSLLVQQRPLRLV
jgi:2-dehydro-3-deoxygluconokinase